MSDKLRLSGVDFTEAKFRKTYEIMATSFSNINAGQISSQTLIVQRNELKETLGDEAANDDNDCETWRELLQEQKANANQLFIAGALTLAEYNQIVDTHNQSVELFEELCGSAPELYL